MNIDPSKTRIINSSHCIEVGGSSWDPTETSVRCRYDSPTSGRFSPHGSSELPLYDLQPVMEVAAQHDLLDVGACADIIKALSESIRRRNP